MKPEPLPEGPTSPRIAFCRTFRWEEADEATRRSLEDGAGLSLPRRFEEIYEFAWTNFEYARHDDRARHLGVGDREIQRDVAARRQAHDMRLFGPCIAQHIAQFFDPRVMTVGVPVGRHA